MAIMAINTVGYNGSTGFLLGLELGKEEIHK